jgi:hypothetical protein
MSSMPIVQGVIINRAEDAADIRSSKSSDVRFEPVGLGLAGNFRIADDPTATS